ncbi:hypothetical protein NDU88_002397 [Pleurodeles waltl]|uniref:Uncharacterized protein n=1 Tax=Pleurodeles waltl TaxID=8319 RepID=A0AAV7UX20_PLEWA|nr:hypothetical protein NDU88_002397 [Pleurodeles waltl]
MHLWRPNPYDSTGESPMQAALGTGGRPAPRQRGANVSINNAPALVDGKGLALRTMVCSRSKLVQGQGRARRLHQARWLSSQGP